MGAAWARHAMCESALIWRSYETFVGDNQGDTDAVCLMIFGTKIERNAADTAV